MTALNVRGAAALYRFEMARWGRTIGQSLIAPVLTTALYLVVFGTAIGRSVPDVGAVSYAAFIIPGLIMLTVMTETMSNASFGIYMPKWAGTIYEVLSAPMSAFEIVIGYVGAATTKSVIIGLVIFATASLLTPIDVHNWAAMLLMLVLIAFAFALFGFILGVWAQSWEQLSAIPMLIITPLTFLGGTFYSISMLPEPWDKVALLNPIVYLVSAFRWTFFGEGDVALGVSLGFLTGFLALGLLIVWLIFRTGYRLKS